MIKTKLGWERADYNRRMAQKRFLRTLPVVFSCVCNQCGCGCLDTVTYDKMPYCPDCGQARLTKTECGWVRDPYSIKHAPWCRR